MPKSLFRDTKTLLQDPQLRNLLLDLCRQANIETIAVTGGASGTAFTAAHHLGRRPTGFKFHSGDSGGIIYADSDDVAAWTDSEITLKCDVATWHGNIDLY